MKEIDNMPDALRNRAPRDSRAFPYGLNNDPFDDPFFNPEQFVQDARDRHAKNVTDMHKSMKRVWAVVLVLQHMNDIKP